MKKLSVKAKVLNENLEILEDDVFMCASSIGTNFDGCRKLYKSQRKHYNVELTKQDIINMVSTYVIFVKGFGEVTENNLKEFCENIY